HRPPPLPPLPPYTPLFRSRRLPRLPAGLVPGLLRRAQLPRSVLRHGELPGQPLLGSRGGRADRSAARHRGPGGAGGAVRADPGPRRRGARPPAAAAGRAARGLHLGGRGSHPGLLLQVPPLADLEVTSSLETEVEETPRRSRRRSPGGGLGRYVLVRFLLIIPTILILMTMV